MGKKRYIKDINAKGLFDNTYETKMPQTIVHNLIVNHFAKKSDKKPKCLFIGWDGCRGDAMKYLVRSENKIVTGEGFAPYDSAINGLKNEGGLYITYVGGDKGCRRETSTAQGWSCALCGKWVKSEWRKGIEWSLDSDYPTALQKVAQMGYSTSFSAIWDVHFNYTYKNEIELAEKNNINESFYKFNEDTEIFKNLCSRIEQNDDMIFGIFENPDMNGHSTDFSEKNYRYVSGIVKLDNTSFKIIDKIKSRSTYDEEDWLIIICSDHGGRGTGHGLHNIQETTTFLAVSKPIK